MKNLTKNKLASSYDRPFKNGVTHLLKALFILATLIIIYESLVPSNSTATINHFDKIAHFGAYFVLMVLAAFAYPKSRLIYLTGFVIIIGAAIEAAQGLMNLGRSASLGDLAANMLGACFAVCIWRAYIWLMASRKR